MRRDAWTTLQDLKICRKNVLRHSERWFRLIWSKRIPMLFIVPHYLGNSHFTHHWTALGWSTSAFQQQIAILSNGLWQEVRNTLSNFKLEGKFEVNRFAQIRIWPKDCFKLSYSYVKLWGFLMETSHNGFILAFAFLYIQTSIIED